MNMRRLPQNISLLAVSVFAVGVIAVAPVSARNGSDDSTTVKTESSSDSGSGSGSGRSSTTARSSDDSASHTETETEHGVETEAEHRSGDDKVTASSRDLRERAQKLLATERQDKKGKSLEDRQKSCQARQASLLKKSENYTRNATKHLGVFDGIYDKVLAFQADKQLTVGDYAELKAAADAKKAAAASAVSALSGLDVTIDCTASDPAAAVATLKTTVKNAKTALHEYRTAIKNLVVALQTAAASESTATSTEAN
jgi:hypothetical protein